MFCNHGHEHLNGTLVGPLGSVSLRTFEWSVGRAARKRVPLAKIEMSAFPWAPRVLFFSPFLLSHLTIPSKCFFFIGLPRKEKEQRGTISVNQVPALWA
jgi:hypothetical protein